ncbi:uncharacterized protein LOC144305776 [Canis aureus]
MAAVCTWGPRTIQTREEESKGTEWPETGEDGTAAPRPGGPLRAAQRPPGGRVVGVPGGSRGEPARKEAAGTCTRIAARGVSLISSPAGSRDSGRIRQLAGRSPNVTKWKREDRKGGNQRGRELAAGRRPAEPSWRPRPTAGPERPRLRGPHGSGSNSQKPGNKRKGRSLGGWKRIGNLGQTLAVVLWEPGPRRGPPAEPRGVRGSGSRAGTVASQRRNTRGTGAGASRSPADPEPQSRVLRNQRPLTSTDAALRGQLCPRRPRGAGGRTSPFHCVPIQAARHFPHLLPHHCRWEVMGGGAEGSPACR